MLVYGFVNDALKIRNSVFLFLGEDDLLFIA